MGSGSYIISLQMKRVPLLPERLSVLIDQGVCIVAASGDHNVWSFPVWSELLHIFLLGALDDTL